MKVAEYIAQFLFEHGCKDAFGIPGGSVLELLYALNEHTAGLCAHLSYHEQCAGFAAAGYAQAGAELGVAYATKGPGISNMLTPIADAYADSLPTFFFTAHEYTGDTSEMRYAHDQEMDTTQIFNTVSKCVIRIDSTKDVAQEIKKGYILATTGRKGPVIFDILSKVLKEDISTENLASDLELEPISAEDEISKYFCQLQSLLKNAQRPVFLIGEGLRQSNVIDSFKIFAQQVDIPILSSRCAEDIMAGNYRYYGYVGSHGVRTANFILSKADLIIALGNRMSFPLQSSSFRPVFDKARLIRVDVDDAELAKEIPNEYKYKIDLLSLFAVKSKREITYANQAWIDVCDELRNILHKCDVTEPTEVIADILKLCDRDSIITSDVGNNEFWLSRAYIYAGISNRILYSSAYGALGCSLGKAIGAYEHSKKPIICFSGDQGIQLNIQELQYVVNNDIPMLIVVLNNHSSGMIKSHERQKFGENFVHTTRQTGYSSPDFAKISAGYGIDYYRYNELDEKQLESIVGNFNTPRILEVAIDEKEDLEPYLSKGSACQELEPKLSEEVYERLNKL